MTFSAAYLLLATTISSTAFAADPVVTVSVSPGRMDRAFAPVRVNVDSIFSAAGVSASLTGLYEVRDTETGDVVPSRQAWTTEGEDTGTVIFRKTGAGEKRYEIAILEAPRADSGIAIPVVGLGEPMSYGRTGVIAGIDGSFSCHAAVVDWDGDGDVDVFVGEGLGGGANATFHGLNYFENVGSTERPLMAHPVRINPYSGTPVCVDWNGDGLLDIISGGKLWVNDGPRGALNLTPDTSALGDAPPFDHVADWDGDGLFDLISATSSGGGNPSESTWSKDLPVGPYTSEGVWRGYDGRGRLLVYRNTGRRGSPRFAGPDTIYVDDPVVGSHVIDVVTGGYPTTGDVDADGDLDVLIGNRFDLYWFENIGTRTEPRFRQGYPLDVHLEDIYIRPSVADMNGDGRPDVLISQENGDVRLMESLGMDERNRPVLSPPVPLRQQDPYIDIGSCGPFDLADFNGDGKPDIIGGNSYGEVWQWLSVPGAGDWTFGEGRRVSAGGELIRIYAGPAGSIQGPGEARYGYVAPELADWDQDGLTDLILCGVWGKNRFYRTKRMTPDGPVFASEVMLQFADPADAIKPAWNWWNPVGGELVTPWRLRPEALDWDGDGLIDYVTIDHEGYLALFPAVSTPAGKRLGALRRVFLSENGEPLRLNLGMNGRSGRYKINFADWDADGDLDLFRSVAEPAGNRLVEPDFESGNALYWENIGGSTFASRGEIVPDPEFRLAGHSSCPQAYDFDGDGELDMLMGAEDGHIFAFHRAYLEQDLPKVSVVEIHAGK